jgi:hypothetical protein
MADPRDDRVSAAYREMPGQGPSPSLDAAIQAAARRAVGARPSFARRWQKPLSVAAVLVLAVAVTLQVEREKPLVGDGAPPSGNAEYAVPQAAPESAAPASKPVEPATPPAQATPDSRAPREAPGARRPLPEAKRLAPVAPAPAADAAPSREAPAPAPVRAPEPAALKAIPASPAPAALGTLNGAGVAPAAPQAAPRAKSERARDASTQEREMSMAREPGTPEQRLERIAGLRARGLHAEADRELAEFRRAFPEFRISEEWLGKVERR